MKTVTKTIINRTFEVGDMFIYMEDKGCFKKGDYLIIKLVGLYEMRFTTRCTIRGESSAAKGTHDWLNGLLNESVVSYEGNLSV